MRNMCLGITAFVVTVGMVSVGAQGRNFSGTWVVDAEKTAAAAAAAVEQAAGGIVARGTGGGAGGRVIAAPTRTASGGGGVATAGAGGGGGGVARGTGTREIAVAGAGGGGGEVRAVAGGRGGGRGVPAELVITMDANTFTTTQGEFQTSYPTNGAETTITLRGTTTAKATASWKGDMLVIEQTIDSPNGPNTNTTSWFLEGDSLVRLTRSRTYFKKK